MTSRNRLHPHSHHHSHHAHNDRQHNQIANLEEITSRTSGPRISRRNFLINSALWVSGLLLSPVVRFGEKILHSLPLASKRIYLAPDDHTDYMWTADETVYQQVFLEMLDYYLDLADQTQNEQSEYQSRWNCDGSFWMWVYEKNRTQSQFNRLIDRIRDGHISVPLNALVVCLGGAPAEAVLRGMYYPGKIERQYNLSFELAYSMENQTLPYGLGALWSGSGAKYSWKGICGCASKVPDAWDRQHDIYWWEGADGSKILMKWHSMLNGNSSMGGYAEARNPSGVVDYVDGDSNFISRYAYAVIGAFGKGWDDLKTLTSEFVNVAKTKSNNDRQVIVSNEQDFFKDFESTYGNQLPTLSCTFGNEWELYCASMAEVSARVKRAVEKLHAAESLASLVSIKNAGFMLNRTAARDQAWMDFGLYWEHCWTADGGVSRNDRRDWSKRLAGEIEAYVETLYSDAASTVSKMIQKPAGSVRFFVFNPLSWGRTDFADLVYTGPTPVHVVDVVGGVEVPSQIITRNGQTMLRILASQIPPVGYRVYEIQSGAGQNFPGGPVADASSGVIQNEAYQVTVAPSGAITSLIDKSRSNQEFAKSISGYSINDLGSNAGNLSVENAGPVSVTLKADSTTPLQHTSRITLVKGSNRILIGNEINQNFGDVYLWRFGFNLANPDVWHEEVGAIIRAKLLADGGHYSPRNARYDWLTLNRFVDMTGNGSGITLSNADCYYMQLGNSSPNVLDTSTSQVSVLAGGQVDGAGLGIPNQGGDNHFLQRFALGTHDSFDAVQAMQFAMEHQNPLVANVVVGGDGYPADQFSWITITNQNILISALKPADDGISNGVILRLWNLSSSEQSFGVNFTDNLIQRAWHTTHIETKLEELQVINGKINDTLAAWQLKTYLLQINVTQPVLDKKVFIPNIGG